MPPGAPAPVAPPAMPSRPNSFKDLSSELPVHIQLIDAADLTIAEGLNTGAFADQEDLAAGLRGVRTDLQKLVAEATRRYKGGKEEAPMTSDSYGGGPPTEGDE